MKKKVHLCIENVKDLSNSILIDYDTFYVGTYYEVIKNEEAGLTKKEIDDLPSSFFFNTNSLKQKLLENLKTYYGFTFGDKNFSYSPEFDSQEKCEQMRSDIIKAVLSSVVVK